MTFQDLFNVAYATPCGVQLGESFVKRPSNIGSGQWMDFWEQLIKKYDESISLSYVKKLEEENDEVCQENDDLRDDVKRLEGEIEDLNNDLAEANYALGQKFGDQI